MSVNWWPNRIVRSQVYEMYRSIPNDVVQCAPCRSVEAILARFDAQLHMSMLFYKSPSTVLIFISCMALYFHPRKKVVLINKANTTSE